MASGVEDGVTLTGRVPINIGDADVAECNVMVAPKACGRQNPHG
jgi:hypothetical protein